MSESTNAHSLYAEKYPPGTEWMDPYLATVYLEDFFDKSEEFIFGKLQIKPSQEKTTFNESDLRFLQAQINFVIKTYSLLDKLRKPLSIDHEVETKNRKLTENFLDKYLDKFKNDHYIIRHLKPQTGKAWVYTTAALCLFSEKDEDNTDEVKLEMRRLLLKGGIDQKNIPEILIITDKRQLTNSLSSLVQSKTE